NVLSIAHGPGELTDCARGLAAARAAGAGPSKATGTTVRIAVTVTRTMEPALSAGLLTRQWTRKQRHRRSAEESNVRQNMSDKTETTKQLEGFLLVILLVISALW